MKGKFTEKAFFLSVSNGEKTCSEKNMLFKKIKLLGTSFRVIGFLFLFLLFIVKNIYLKLHTRCILHVCEIWTVWLKSDPEW